MTSTLQSTQYFEKIENGARYRIYLYEFEASSPFLCRSALDAADGVHGELTKNISSEAEATFRKLVGQDLRLNLTYKQRAIIASKACRSSMIFALENMGWTFYGNK